MVKGKEGWKEVFQGVYLVKYAFQCIGLSLN